MTAVEDAARLVEHARRQREADGEDRDQAERDARRRAAVERGRRADRGGRPLAAVEDGDGPEVEPPPPLPAFPRFPVDKISGPLAEFIGWGVRDGLHAECVAATGLGALATVSGPARLRLTDAKVLRPVLWIPLIGIPSAGKSPALEHAFTPIRAEYAERVEEYGEQLADWQSAYEADPKHAGPRPPYPQPYELDDATIEAVARWLKSRGAGSGDTSGAVVDDELAAFLEGLGQYKGGHGADKAKWLKLWTGAALHIQRVGGGGNTNEINLYVPEPVVSIVGLMTPDSLPLLGRPGTGFRPRWLPFYAPPAKPQWLEAGEYPPEWTGCMAALLAERGPREWSLKGAARDVWAEARDRWEKQQEEPEPDDVIEALRKADVQCLRVALVIAESMRPGGGGAIPLAAVRSAVAIVDYAIGVWRALPGGGTMNTSRYEEVMDSAHLRLLAWLETRAPRSEGLPEGSPPRPGATRRDIQQWLHERPAKVDALIAEHRERFPGCVVAASQEGGKGGGLPRLIIYSPQREQLGAGNIGVAATPIRNLCNTDPSHESAGESVRGSANIGVALRNTDPRNTDPATPIRGPRADSGEPVGGGSGGGAPSQPEPVEADQEDAPDWVREPPADLDDPGPEPTDSDGWPASETGPCRGCGRPTRLYGEHGRTLCAACSAASDGAPKCGTDWLRSRKGAGQ